MGDDDFASLLRLFRPAPGLLMHDWGDSAAVVHVPGTGTTHLVDASVAVLLACWDDAGVESQAACSAAPGPAPAAGPASSEEAAALQSQLPALLRAGILQHSPAA